MLSTSKRSIAGSKTSDATTIGEGRLVGRATAQLYLAAEAPASKNYRASEVDVPQGRFTISAMLDLFKAVSLRGSMRRLRRGRTRPSRFKATARRRAARSARQRLSLGGKGGLDLDGKKVSSISTRLGPHRPGAARHWRELPASVSQNCSKIKCAAP